MNFDRDRFTGYNRPMNRRDMDEQPDHRIPMVDRKPESEKGKRK